MAEKIDFLILSDLKIDLKEEAIKTIIEKLEQENYLNDKEQFFKDVVERESKYPTYIGYGMGLPHSQSMVVNRPCVAISRLKNDIDWTSEKEKVDTVFLIAVPKESKDNLHLKILAKLSRLLMHEDFREGVKNLKEKELLELLNKKIEE